MSGSDTLLIVDPERFRTLAGAFATPEPEESWLRSTFEQFGIEFERFWEPEYADELKASSEDRTQVLNEAFSALVGHGESFDTSLDLLLSVVSARNSDLQLLRTFFTDLDFDVELPSSIQPVEYGLLGIWSAVKLVGPFERERRFATRDGVEGYFTTQSYSVADRMRGIPGKDRALEKEWLSEGFWATWKDLMDLGAQAINDGSHVALVEWD